MSNPPLVLASASPRRAELLEQIGLKFTVAPANIDEQVLDGEAPEIYVERMAREKAAAVAVPGVLTLGADTTVVKDGRILGKPESEQQAVEMLLFLSDSWHQVLTGVAVSDGSVLRSQVVTTRVKLVAISEQVARDYVRTGEPQDKAGGYGIQGIGGIFTCKIEGSYGAVVGLPLTETERLLERSGFDTWRCRIDG